MGGDFAPRATIAGALQALDELDAATRCSSSGRPPSSKTSSPSFSSGELARFARMCATGSTIVEAPDNDRHGRQADRRAAQEAEQSDGRRHQAAGRRKVRRLRIRRQYRRADGCRPPCLLGAAAGPHAAARSLTIFPTARKPIVLPRFRRERRLLPERARSVRLARRGLRRVRARPRRILSSDFSTSEKRKRRETRSRKRRTAVSELPASTFHGNVEGRDLPAGASDRGPLDVVVCDGFVGNVVLKFYEAVIADDRPTADRRDPEIDMPSA